MSQTDHLHVWPSHDLIIVLNSFKDMSALQNCHATNPVLTNAHWLHRGLSSGARDDKIGITKIIGFRWYRIRLSLGKNQRCENCKLEQMVT